MNWLKILLLLIFLGNILACMYDAGKYSQGYKEVREGIRWALIEAIASIINLIMFLIVLFYM